MALGSIPEAEKASRLSKGEAEAAGAGDSPAFGVGPGCAAGGEEEGAGMLSCPCPWPWPWPGLAMWLDGGGLDGLKRAGCREVVGVGYGAGAGGEPRPELKLPDREDRRLGAAAATAAGG